MTSGAGRERGGGGHPALPGAAVVSRARPAEAGRSAPGPSWARVHSVRRLSFGLSRLVVAEASQIRVAQMPGLVVVVGHGRRDDAAVLVLLHVPRVALLLGEARPGPLGQRTLEVDPTALHLELLGRVEVRVPRLDDLSHLLVHVRREDVVVGQHQQHAVDAVGPVLGHQAVDVGLVVVLQDDALRLHLRIEGGVYALSVVVRRDDAAFLVLALVLSGDRHDQVPQRDHDGERDGDGGDHLGFGEPVHTFCTSFSLWFRVKLPTRRSRSARSATAFPSGSR